MKSGKIIAFIWIVCIQNIQAQTTIVDSIIHDGIWRNYRLFLPSGFTTSSNLPLVFNLHGYTSSAVEQELYTGFNNIADTAKFVVCHPNGVNNSWNVLGIGGADDIGFLDTLITLFSNQYNINLSRVYSTGMSNGGFMSGLLGCSLSNRFAAIAPVAGTNFSAIHNSCFPDRHVPVLYIHGTDDPVVSYSGSSGYVSATDFMDLWSQENQCSAIPDTFQLPDIDTSDLCTAERITWLSCDSNKQVIHYRIIDGGHSWPGAFFPIGVTNQDFNASSVIWEFFNQFSLNTSIENITGKNKINISPNPFTSFTEIELPLPIESEINIYSMDGILVKSLYSTEKNIRINTEEFQAGLYLVNIMFQNMHESFRIMKIN